MISGWWARLLRGPGVLVRLLADNAAYPALLRIEGVVYGPDLKLSGRPDVRISPEGEIVLGVGVTLLSRPSANPLRLTQPCTLALLKPGATIRIGDHVALSGAVICAAVRVEIGNHTLIGANCRIMDTNFHPLNPEMRRENRNLGMSSSPVLIGNDCFIGTGAIVLKGTCLGDGCVVGAGAVVSGTFSPRSLIAGNPARLVRQMPGRNSSA